MTEHNTILRILEKRAQRFRPGLRLVQDSSGLDRRVDETGTLEEEEETLEMIRDRERAAELDEARELTSIRDEVLEIHGNRPGRKQDGVIRLMYENANGIDGRFTENWKVEKARELHDELEVDVVAYNEHKLNLKHKMNKVGFNQLFWGGEAEVRSVVAHNVHENRRKRVQEGGTSMLMFGGIIDYFDMSLSGKDDTGLGRWVVMTLRGDGMTTRMVCGYNPCGNDKPNSGTVYHQQQRYWLEKRRCATCPRIKFREDLLEQLTKWREDGDKLIVCLDANENIYRKAIGKALTSVDGLAMKEVVGDFTGVPIGPTYFRGSKPIDAIWATSDVDVVGACIMPAGFGIGDHRVFVVDFRASSLIGLEPKKIVRPQARRLNCKLPGAVQRYNTLFEKKIRKHRLVERIGMVHQAGLPSDTTKLLLDKIDNEGKQYMKNSEKRCRKIKSGRIPFSPEAAKWIRRVQVYKSLLKYVQVGRGNRGNLRRTAYRAGIPSPFRLSEEDIRARLEVGKKHCEYYRQHGKRYRRRHLQERLEMAREEDNDEAERQILGSIKRERERAFWRRLRYAMSSRTGGSVQAVQVEDDDGNIEVYSTQEEVHEAIWSNIHRKRFYLAEEAPICSGRLRGEFGYNADTTAGDEILDGTYWYDPDFDTNTKAICEELAQIRTIIPENSISDIIRHGEWGNFWRKAREETSSSESGLHFSHYKAGASSPLISHYHSTKASVVLKSGQGLERWSRGMSVMLEKVAGCQLINKLRSILLMEADFNCVNKIIYGNRMLTNVRKYDLMPDEIFSERNRTAAEGSLTKVLFYDIARQSRLAAGISSVDADNCYDRVAHAIASLVFRSFGVSKEATGAMLKSIQEMKFFLRTAFGDSADFAGAQVEIKTQGLCQGNGAAPAGWAVVSIAILRAHKKRGHGAQFCCSISLVRSDLSAVLYVDDTDVIHIRMNETESVQDAFLGLQESVISWGRLLIATGGSLKPNKCFYHLISFSWKPDGTWVYDTNEEDEALQIMIPLPDGSFALIEHCGVETAHETLGVLTCPTGDFAPAIGAMKERAQGWIDRAASGKLNRRHFWLLTTCQFWPKVGFGIGLNPAPYAVLAECLMKQYYELVPLGGIRRSANRMVRQLDGGFYGVGCPHPAIECLAAQSTMFLTHYGCDTTVGRLLQVSLELMIMELGMSSQPFEVDFIRHGKWVTDSWLKSLWEKSFIFGICFEEGRLKIGPPRTGDEWLMRMFLRMGFTEAELIRLNRVRIHQQVLFYSDVMDARGTVVDKRYLVPRRADESWSLYKFPREQPPPKDFRLWSHALLQLRTVRQTLPLGPYIDRGHKVWNWRYVEEENVLLHFHDDIMDVYSPSEVPRYANRPNCWTRSRVDQPAIERGDICSVLPLALAVWRISSCTPAFRPAEPPSTLHEVFQEWGCTWLWEDLQWRGDIDWMQSAITNGTCVVVADGSYQPSVRKDLCSTGFFFECTEGSGKLVGSFAEFSVSANAYRGELLGLMAAHLVLLGINTLVPDLQGKVTVFSDCRGALDKVKGLPPLRLPAKCKHSDILKNILVNCTKLSFAIEFEHIEAHQDDTTEFRLLSRPAQLNCAVDAGAKRRLLEADAVGEVGRRRFPLEPVVCYVGNQKMTTDTSDSIRFWAHRRLAREALVDSKVLNERQFDLIAWEFVSKGLKSTPRLFQMWACKQVWDIAATNYLRSKWDATVEKWCPSCRRMKETASHVLHCNEVGRVETLHATIGFLDDWLEEVETEDTLRRCIVKFARGRGFMSMGTICRNMSEKYVRMAEAQDTIGWRRFMEGMISKHLVSLYADHRALVGEGMSTEAWASQLTVRLLEVTHGQWIYRNIQVHDETCGAIRTREKEQLQADIEEQMELGFEGFVEMDRSLASVSLEDLESSNGDLQEYWLLAMRAARVAKELAASTAAIDTLPD